MDTQNSEPLEITLSRLMIDAGLTLAVAESCTGGLIGHRITNVAGSSAYFLGGVIAYAYDAKERILEVTHDILYDYGAVSEVGLVYIALSARDADRCEQFVWAGDREMNKSLSADAALRLLIEYLCE